MTTEAQEYERPASIVTHEKFAGTSHGPGALKGAGSDGTFGGMDPWQQSVETRLGELRGDVRQVLYATVGGAAFLLAAFATGFLFLLDRVDNSTATMVAKVDPVAAQVVETNERAARIEGLLEKDRPRR